jgi:hypothetical protein
MRAMKHRIHAVQADPDPRSAALGDSRAEGSQQRFNLRPSSIRTKRVLEDLFERSPVSAIHINVVSDCGIVANPFARRLAGNT